MLSNLDLGWIFSDAQIDECWSRWKKAFLDIMDTCIPKSMLPDRRSVPWMTKEIVQAIRRRNYFYRKAKHSNSGNYHSKYKNLRSRVITMLRQSKHNFFKNLNPISNKAFWKAVRCLNKKTSSIPTLTTSASTATTDREKAELLNAHFSSCFNNSLPPIAADYASTPISSEFPEGLRCTEDEVRKLLSTIDPSKASGPDCISARMLKSTAMSIAPAVTQLFSISLTLGKLPKEWKVAQVTPIPKSSQTSDPTNYRPMSLLSILSKLLEKHVHGYLLEHLEEHSPISDMQWGFTKGKSTTGTLLTATNSWHQALEAGADVCAVFLDLSKTFDKVPHRSLMNKLTDLNINPHALKWLGDYLSQRSQYVVVNGESSTSTQVISGVPQGSVLGPLLFLIYINGVTEIPLNDGCMLLYADDILLYRQIQSSSDYQLFQQDIDAMESWFSQNNLELNASKCKYMVISRKCQHHQPMNQLTISNALLEKVSDFKYMGVWLSDNLTWTKHVEQITKRATKQAGLIFRRFYAHSSSESIKQLYVSFVRPHLEYAAPVWDPHCNSHINALERVQKFSLRMSYKAWDEEYDNLLSRANLQPLAKRRKFLKVCYLYQIINGTSNFPNSPIVRRNMDPRLRSSESQQLCQPFARTNAYHHSFFPHTISIWNSLPAPVHRCSSLPVFKRHVMTYM